MPVLRAARSADELALLRAVTADLTDAVALSVYADFLQDHDDPRGDFLREFARAYESRKTLPIFTPDLPAPWVDVLALRPRRKVRHARNGPAFEPVFEMYLKAARPCVRFSLGDDGSADDFPPGATRAGGSPDLPPGAVWPPPDEFDNATPFLFQLDLADLRGTFAEGVLPDEGLLVVYGCPDSYTQGGRMFYYPPGAKLVRSAVPAEVADRYPQGHARPRAMTLSDSLMYRWPDLLPRQRDAAQHAHEILVESEGHLLCPSLSAAEAAEVVSAEAHPTNHPLLVRVYGDYTMDWHFGDGGSLSIHAARDQAQRGDFREAYHWTE